MDLMKRRFILFGMKEFYPFGGMGDALETFDTPEQYEKLKKYEKGEFATFEVFDTHTFRTTTSHGGRILPEVEFD